MMPWLICCQDKGNYTEISKSKQDDLVDHNDYDAMVDPAVKKLVTIQKYPNINRMT